MCVVYKTFITFPLLSFQVQIFNPLEYPDAPSGGVSEKLVEVGTEAFIRVDSVTFITNDESRRFAPQTVRYNISIIK